MSGDLHPLLQSLTLRTEFSPFCTLALPPSSHLVLTSEDKTSHQLPVNVAQVEDGYDGTPSTVAASHSLNRILLLLLFLYPSLLLLLLTYSLTWF